MTTLEIILISLLWIILGIYLSEKWCKVEKVKIRDFGWATAITIIIAPIILVGAIVRQVFIEDWK